MLQETDVGSADSRYSCLLSMLLRGSSWALLAAAPAAFAPLSGTFTPLELKVALILVSYKSNRKISNKVASSNLVSILVVKRNREND